MPLNLRNLSVSEWSHTRMDTLRGLWSYCPWKYPKLSGIQSWKSTLIVLGAGDLDQAISRAAFQPQLFSDYVIIDWENKIKNKDGTVCVHGLRQMT